MAPNAIHVIEYLNFGAMISCLALFAAFYTMSLTPVKRSAKRGERAWSDCVKFRLVATIFETLTVVTLIVWAIHPIPALDFKIFPEWWHAFLLGLVLLPPFLALAYVGMRDAGTESIRPSAETKLYGGIYEHVRHPQTLGEFPTWAIFGLMTNSWTALVVGSAFVVAYTPIMIKVEEADLVRRFGEEYEEYRRRVGCLFPRLRSMGKS
ncbi:MAG: hypothetical protein Kow0069_35920 [Promethearchaeota archaeon]